MKPYLFCILFTVMTFVGNTQSWSKKYFTNSDRQESVNCVTQTNDGNFVIAGSGFPGNPGLIVCFKVDKSGELLWDASYGPGGHVRAQKIVAMLDGGFAIAGSGSGGKLFFSQYDSSGREKSLAYLKEDANYAVAGFELLENGDFLLFGRTDRNPVLTSYDSELFVMRLDQNGNELYYKIVDFPEEINVFGNDIIMADDEFFYTSTAWPDMIVMKWRLVDGELIWERNLGEGGISELELTKDSSSLLVAATSFVDAKSAVIMTLDLEGEVQSSYTLPKDPEYSGTEMESLVIQADGTYVLSVLSYSFEFQNSVTRLIHLSEDYELICQIQILEGIQTFPRELLLTEEGQLLLIAEAKESDETHQFPLVALYESPCDSVSTLSSSKLLSEYNDRVVIYPNPFSNFVQIENSFDNDNVRISIYNSSGLLIRHENVTSDTVNLSELESGIYYFVIYKNDTLLSVKKLVK